MTPPNAMALATSLAATPMCAEMSSAKMIDRKGSLKDSHSPTQERLNIAWNVKRKYAMATMRNPVFIGEKKFGFGIVLKKTSRCQLLLSIWLNEGALGF